MTFERENQMVAPAQEWLHGQGLMVKREFPTPWGVCDLVGCSLNKNKVRRRLALRQTQPIRSPLRVHLLSLIPDDTSQRTIEIDELCADFGGYLDQERIKVELGRLLCDRFIEEPSPGAYFKRNGWMPLHKRLVAIELKLTRIDDALHQAINNLDFADESYVGLPTCVVNRIVDRKKEVHFKNNGIGVLSIDPTSCEVVLKAAPREVHPDAVVQEHSVERFWLAHLRGNGA